MVSFSCVWQEYVFQSNLRKYANSSPTFLCQRVEDTFSLRFLPDSTSTIVP